MNSLSNRTDKKDGKQKSIALIILIIIAICVAASFILIRLTRLTTHTLSVQSTSPSNYSSPEDGLSIAIDYIVRQSNCQEGIAILNNIIQQLPENGDAYYYRSYCYYQMLSGQTILSTQKENVSNALNDIDEAIIYGTNHPDIQKGDTYYLRFLILGRKEGYTETLTDQNYIRQLELENLITSVVLGNSNKYSHREIPVIYFQIGKCEDGWTAMDFVRHKEGLSAPPSAFLYYVESWGYLCNGDLNKALESIEKSIELYPTPERWFVKANLLYFSGRSDEALDLLNQLINQEPNFSGARYILRALIQYEKGDRVQAEQDLKTGLANTWGGGGLDYYILGQMAKDDHNNDLAIEYLSKAKIYLLAEYAPLQSRIDNELINLGADLPGKQIAPELIVTPMVVPTLVNPPDYPTNILGLQYPPNPIIVKAENGSGPLFINGDRYFSYLFQPITETQITSVQKLTVHIQPEIGSEDISIILLLWNPKTGEWKVIPTKPTSVEIEKPETYVDSNANIYVSIYTPNGRVINLKDLWITLEATNSENSTIKIDKINSP